MSDTIVKRAVGRPLSADGEVTKAKVREFIDRRGKEGFTINEIVKETNLRRESVNNHIGLLVGRGELVRCSNVRGSGRGRPMTMFKVVEVVAKDVG